MQKLNANARPFNPAFAPAASIPVLPHHPPSPFFLQTCFFYPTPYIPPTQNPYSHNIQCYIPAPHLPQPFSESLQESDRRGDLDDQTTPTVSVSSRCVARGPRVSGGRHHLSRSWQKGTCSRVFWTPKVSAESKSLAAAPPPDFESREAAAGKTTVMLKNIPNKFSKQEILDLLDEHCRKENTKIFEEGSAAANSTQLSEYDFLYLPMDFLSGSNLGYAFVNFTSTVAAGRLHREMHKKPWNVYASRKISEVTHAKIQGSDALLNHFKSSIFTCCSAQYLPVYFHPSRDGFRQTKERLVGKLVYQ